MKVYGQLKFAAFEQLTTDPTLLFAGRVWFNKTSEKLKFYDGEDTQHIPHTGQLADFVYDNTISELLATDPQAAIDEVEARLSTVEEDKAEADSVVTLTGDQTIEGVKSFEDKLQLKRLATAPSNASSTYLGFYAKTDGKLYTIDSSGNEVPVGSDSSEINLVRNGNAETPDIPWVLRVNNTPGALPTPNAASNYTGSQVLFTRTGTALNGDHSWALNKITGNNQGVFIQQEIDVPSGYDESVFTWEWVEDRFGTVPDGVTVHVFRWDFFGSNWGDEVELKDDTDNARVQKLFSLESTQSIKLLLVFHIASTDTGNFGIVFDDMVLRPGQVRQRPFEQPLVLSELSDTPSDNPDSGTKKLYAKDDGGVYTLDSEGNELPVGSSSDDFNFFPNGDAELPVNPWEVVQNDITPLLNLGGGDGVDITLVDDSAPVTIVVADKVVNEPLDVSVDGRVITITKSIAIVGLGPAPDNTNADAASELNSNASHLVSASVVGAGSFTSVTTGEYFLNETIESPTPNVTTDAESGVTITRSDADPLNGTHSWLFSKDAADRQGHTLRAEVEIPLGYRGQELFWKFIQRTTGFPIDGVLPFVSSWNGTDWDAPVALNAQQTGKKEVYKLSLDETEKVLVQLHVATDDATASTLKVDDVRVTPDSFVPVTVERSDVIDVSDSGDFTAGKILVARVADTITVDVLENISFPANNVPASADGLLPDWARPTTTKSHVYRFTSTQIRRIAVTANGAVSFEFAAIADGAASNRVTSSAEASITYPVEQTEPTPLVSTTEAVDQTSTLQLELGASQEAVSGVETEVALDTVSISRGKSAVRSGSRILIEDDGDYLINFGVGASQLSADEGRVIGRVRVERDSSVVLTIEDRAWKDTGTGNTVVSTEKSKTLPLQKGDQVYLTLQQEAGANRNIATAKEYTFLEVKRDQDLTTLVPFFDGKFNKMPELPIDYEQREVDYDNDSHVPIVASWSNSFGSVVRLADGTQECIVSSIDYSQTSSVRSNVTWTFPAPFSDTNYTVQHSSKGGVKEGTYLNSDIGSTLTFSISNSSASLNIYKSGDDAPNMPSDLVIGGWAIAKGQWRAIPSS